MILIVGIVALVVMLGLSVGLTLCACALARRSDETADAELLGTPLLPDEPLVVTRRFARDPDGRPIAAPRREAQPAPRQTAHVVGG